MAKLQRGNSFFWLVVILFFLGSAGCGNAPTPPPASSPTETPSSLFASVDFEDGTDGALKVACGGSCDVNHNCTLRNDPVNAHSGSWYGECFADTALASDARVMFRWVFCGSSILPTGPCQPAATGSWTHDFYIYVPQSVITSLASQPCTNGQVKLWRSRTSMNTNPSDFKGWDIGIMGPEQNCGNGDRVDLVCDSGICGGTARQVVPALTGDVWHHVCIEYWRPQGRGNVVVYFDNHRAASIMDDPNLGDDVEYQGGNIGADTLEVNNNMMFRMRVDDVRWRFGKHCT